ncbi:MAG: PilZ domain-containing protein [Proteobacteria bacterium]|nr:PilZ domain-containing protein [Pseudomonadota bacterium]
MIDNIKRKLQLFFPGELFSSKTIEEDLANGVLLTGKESILPYLQTALLDEKVLEVQLDGMPMVYFSRLKDGIPVPLETDVDVDTNSTQYESEEGEYLAAMSNIVTLPLEPGLGNLHLRYSSRIVLRMFTSTFAVEMATTFEDLAKVHDIPVLCLAFPELARIVYNAREFRAKVPESLDFVSSIEIDDEGSEMDTRPVNISIRGLSFSVKKKEQKLFKVNTVYSLKLFVEDELLIRIKGTVRYFARIRKRSGIEYLCGIEFDFQTKIQSAVIESIVALVQRAHLKELAEKSDATGINLIA